MTDNAIDAVIHEPDLGAIIDLYTLDLSHLGVGMIYFSPSAFDGGPIVWNGHPYNPKAISVSGFEWNGQGALPTPKMQFSNISNDMMALVVQYGDLLGVEVTRTTTLARFLDGQPDADPNAAFPTEYYTIEQKTGAANDIIEFALASVLDQQGRLLPGRQVLRDYCNLIYRRWNGTAFDYTFATCPYTGGAFFKVDGSPTTDPALDAAGKQVVTCCKARFGTNAPLPFGGFPGVARVHV